MAQPALQASFNSGEWSTKLFARVDLEKYHSAAALLLNWFVDYRGGASTRTGTKYLLQAYKSASAVRLIPFQASQSIGYALEFGDQYIRFYNNGAPVLETGLNITGVTRANPCVVSVTNTYTTGDVDWVYISGVSGMTQLNGHYYKVHVAAAGSITLYDLFGNPVDSSAFGIWTAGGTTQRVYTLVSPYAAADLALIKYAQSANILVLCHPSYNPQILTYNSATNWTITSILIGAGIGVPTGTAATTTLGAGSVNYSYIVTAVDINGQESPASASATLANKLDIRSTAGTNAITWSAVTGAVSYNIYRAELVYGAAVPSGAMFGYIGNCTGLTFNDSNISPDFTLTPPVANNPFQGAGVASTTVSNPGSYTATPAVTFAAAPAGGVTATGTANMKALTVSIGSGGFGYGTFNVLNLGNGVSVTVTGVGGGGVVSSIVLNTAGLVAGAVPTNPIPTTGGTGTGATINVDTWGIASINLTGSGAGYASPPAISFTLAGGGVASATLAAASAGNPSVPCFVNQRLVLAAQQTATNTFSGSIPGSYYNFNISNPLQPDDAFTATLSANQLQDIREAVATQAGMILFTTTTAWLINGGSAGATLTAIDLTANPQSYVGSADLPPIISNYDILFVQAKGSIVRDMSYNFYANIFTGTDISILASHLFYGYTLQQWAWAEEPFKVVWIVRNDGTMLTLTFLKEQELTAWAHSTTSGLFKSVATITESVAVGRVDAVYTVVQRTVQGQSLQYIERFTERSYATKSDPWCVDAGLQYSGAPATSFTGGEHLTGLTVTGLADGVVIAPFVMPALGNFTLATPASKVTIGLGYNCDLQTLPLDPREMERISQGKVKAVNAVDLRVEQALGLKIGSDFTKLVSIKDLTLGNVNSMATGLPLGQQQVTDLWTGDARTFIDRTYTVLGQYCIRQDQPYPATVLGVFPQVLVGDTPK